MASYRRKKQKTDANVTSVIIVVLYVFLGRKVSTLSQNPEIFKEKPLLRPPYFTICQKCESLYSKISA